MSEESKQCLPLQRRESQLNETLELWTGFHTEAWEPDNAVRSLTVNSRPRWIVNTACCSSLLIGTKRRFGRPSALQIASASFRSFLPVFRYGAINWGRSTLPRAPTGLTPVPSRGNHGPLPNQSDQPAHWQKTASQGPASGSAGEPP